MSETQIPSEINLGSLHDRLRKMTDAGLLRQSIHTASD